MPPARKRKRFKKDGPYLNWQFRITCPCGHDNASDYYISPQMVASNSGDIKLSDDSFEVICKKCRRMYRLSLNLKYIGQVKAKKRGG